MTYETLILKADRFGLKVKELDLRTKDGFCKDNRIAISNKLKTDAEKKCILAEEIGHYFTTVGDISDQDKIENRKQELKARRFGNKLLVTPENLIKAYENGVQTRYDLIDFFDITEEFLEEVIQDLRMTYGMGCKIGKYYLMLEPTFGVVDIFA